MADPRSSPESGPRNRFSVPVSSSVTSTLYLYLRSASPFSVRPNCLSAIHRQPDSAEHWPEGKPQGNRRQQRASPRRIPNRTSLPLRQPWSLPLTWRNPLSTIVLTGVKGVGKTTLAARL